MRQRTARLLAVLLTVPALAWGSPAGTQAAVAAGSEPQPPAATPTVDCDGREVLLLMDQSMSLWDTDPHDQRIDAARTLIRSLDPGMAGADHPVRLSIATFGERVESLGSFALPGAAAEAIAAVEGLPGRGLERNTDYVLALQHAADHFAGVDSADPACEQLLWFTDGAYSIDALDGVRGYTTLTDSNAIEAQLGSFVCGPLPADGRPTGGGVPAPLSESIRRAGFRVELIDLRIPGAEGPSSRQERQATDLVLARLLGGDPGCGVEGERLEVGAAGQLADEFFRRGQEGQGRQPAECAPLTSGFPAALLASVAARADAVAAPVTISIDGVPVTTGTEVASLELTDEQRHGLLTVDGGGAPLSACFGVLEGQPRLVSEAKVFSGAESTTLLVAVGGPGAVEAPDQRVGPDHVDVEFAVGDRPAEASWDQAQAVWRVTVEDPRQATSIVAIATVKGGPTLPRLDQQLALVDDPPLPVIAWTGPPAIEGAGRHQGNLRVVPLADTRGSLCITFERPDVSGVQGTLHLPTEPVCGSDRAPFDIPVALDVDEARNGQATVAAAFRTRYQDPDGSERELEDTGHVEFPTLTLTKPADTGRQWLLTSALVLGSVLVPLAVLLIYTNLRRRLPDPSGYKVAEVEVPRLSGGALGTPRDELRMQDFRAVGGGRSRHDLSQGLHLRRRPTLNPFAPFLAQACDAAARLRVTPAVRESRRRSRAWVPAAYDHLVILRQPTDGAAATAVAVVRSTTTPAQASRILRDALRRLDTPASRANEDAGELRPPDGPVEREDAPPPPPPPPAGRTPAPVGAPTRRLSTPPPPPPLPPRRG